MPSARPPTRLLTSWRAALLAAGADDEATIAVAERAIVRCLFIRLCENHGLVPPGTVATLARDAEPERQISAHLEGIVVVPDAARDPGLAVAPPAGPLRAILAALARSGPPYHFDALPLETLGHAYEQLRGLPRASAAGHDHGAKTRTPRQASGTYYTPPEVVDYLVRHGVVPLLTSGAVEGEDTPSVLDPACGAGVLLLGAYRLLLTTYRDRHLAAGPQRSAAPLRQDARGDWHLTTTERRRLLLAHIHGVDRDPQALELAAMTLAIAVGPDNAADRPPAPLDLARNLRCGDALLGPDFRNHPAASALTAADIAALRPLDWHAAFPSIMARGGFDAVIANPPYLSLAGRQAVALPGPVRAYILGRFGDGGWPATHTFFIAQAVRALSRRRCTFVVPDQVGHLVGYAPTRDLIARETGLEEVRYWGERVFADATTPALTFVTDRAHDGPTSIIEPGRPATVATVAPGAPWLGGATTGLLAKLRLGTESLGALVGDPGVHTGNCASGLLAPLTAASTGAVPILEGRQIGRFRCAAPTRALHLDYAPQPGDYFTIRPPARYADAPFVIRQTASVPIVGPRRHATYFRNSLLALYPPTDGRAVEFLVGLLNSSLLRHAYRLAERESRQRAFPQVKVGALRRLPIRRLDLADPRDRAHHDAIIAAVRRLLALNEVDADPPRIAHEERALDKLVYALYGLTDAEIALVEDATRAPLILGSADAGEGATATRQEEEAMAHADDYTIRPARPDEYAALPAIERAAAAQFRATPFPEMADAALSAEGLDGAHDRVWLALAPGDEPVGFAITHSLDTDTHLHELDVHPAHARRGLGARLIAAVAAEARREGHRAMTLTTFRDIPWNAPYYARLGFRILADDELTPALRAILRAEVVAGLPGAARVAMRLDLGGVASISSGAASPRTD